MIAYRIAAGPRLVQVELAGDGFELLFVRLVQTDPGKPVALTAGLVGLLQRIWCPGPLTVHIDGLVDDHPGIIPWAVW
jgi:hypothetical protein